MSDLADGFEPMADDDYELVILPPGAEEPQVDDDKVTLTKAELEQLKAEKANAENSAIAQLAQKLENRPVNVQVPVQQQQEISDEEFYKTFEADLFTPGKTAQALQRYTDRVAGRQFAALQSEIASLRNQVSSGAATGVDRFVRDTYGAEITELLGKLPLAQQGRADAQEWALAQVKHRHFNDVVDYEIKQRQQKADTQQQQQESTAKKAPYSGSATGASAPKKISVKPTDADKAYARRNYMSVEDAVKIRLRREGKIQ